MSQRCQLRTSASRIAQLTGALMSADLMIGVHLAISLLTRSANAFGPRGEKPLKLRPVEGIVLVVDRRTDHEASSDRRWAAGDYRRRLRGLRLLLMISAQVRRPSSRRASVFRVEVRE